MMAFRRSPSSPASASSGVDVGHAASPRPHARPRAKSLETWFPQTAFMGASTFSGVNGTERRRSPVEDRVGDVRRHDRRGAVRPAATTGIYLATPAGDYCASSQVLDPASLTATFVKWMRSGLPSPDPGRSSAMSSGPAFL